MNLQGLRVNGDHDYVAVHGRSPQRRLKCGRDTCCVHGGIHASSAGEIAQRQTTSVSRGSSTCLQHRARNHVRDGRQTDRS